jgi:hypothetical protein
MLTLFTFPKKSLKSMNKDELLKTFKYLELSIDVTLTKSQLIQLLESSDKMKNDTSFDKYNSRIQVKYNGYCYYVNTDCYYKSFIVTKETSDNIYGDLLYGNGRRVYQVIYDKHGDKWIHDASIKEVLFDRIKGVLYVIKYRYIINNIHYLQNNNVIIPDIYTHMKLLIINTFPQDMFVII